MKEINGAVTFQVAGIRFTARPYMLENKKEWMKVMPEIPEVKVSTDEGGEFTLPEDTAKYDLAAKILDKIANRLPFFDSAYKMSYSSPEESEQVQTIPTLWINLSERDKGSWWAPWNIAVSLINRLYQVTDRNFIITHLTTVVESLHSEMGRTELKTKYDNGIYQEKDPFKALRQILWENIGAVRLKVPSGDLAIKVAEYFLKRPFEEKDKELLVNMDNLIKVLLVPKDPTIIQPYERGRLGWSVENLIDQLVIEFQKTQPGTFTAKEVEKEKAITAPMQK